MFLPFLPSQVAHLTCNNTTAATLTTVGALRVWEYRAPGAYAWEARSPHVVSADFNYVSAVFVRLFFFIDLISSGWL